MKTPFKITFKKEIDGNIPNEKIINDFIYNFKLHSFVYFTRLNKNTIYAENDYHRFGWDFNPFGDIEVVEINIKEKQNNKKEIIYSLSLVKFLRGILLLFALVIIICLISNSIIDLNYDLIYLGLILSFSFIFLFFLVLRNLSLFKKTLKYGAGNIKYYNWDKIMKTKTDKELKEIISGKSNYSDRVIIFAKKEFKKRHSENKKY